MSFEPIPAYKRPCTDQQHNAPTLLHIPAGMQYRHTCPGRGAETVLLGAEVTC